MRTELYSVRSSAEEVAYINNNLKKIATYINEKAGIKILFKTEIDCNAKKIKIDLLESFEAANPPEFHIFLNALDTKDQSSFDELFKPVLEAVEKDLRKKYEKKNIQIKAYPHIKIYPITNLGTEYPAYCFIYKRRKFLVLPVISLVEKELEDFVSDAVIEAKKIFSEAFHTCPEGYLFTNEKPATVFDKLLATFNIQRNTPTPETEEFELTTAEVDNLQVPGLLIDVPKPADNPIHIADEKTIEAPKAVVAHRDPSAPLPEVVSDFQVKPAKKSRRNKNNPETQTANTETTTADTKKEKADNSSAANVKAETKSKKNSAKNSKNKASDKSVKNAKAKSKAKNKNASKNKAVTKPAKKETIKEKNEKPTLKDFLLSFIPMKGDGVKNIIRKVVVLAAIAVFFTGSYMLLKFYVIDPGVNRATMQEIQDIFYNTDETYIEEYTDADGNVHQKVVTRKNWDEVKKVNKEIVAWIKQPGTDIDYPVLYHKGDNENSQYYLYKDYKKKPSDFGSIFLDYRCTDNGADSRHVILHGHNMGSDKDAMFGSFIRYTIKDGRTQANLDYYKSHSTFSYDTPNENGEWVVFAVLKLDVANKNKVFNYLQTEFTNDAQYMNFIYNIKERSYFNVDVPINENDRLLTLSTCSYETDTMRTIVIARQVRPGEDVSKYVNSAKGKTPASTVSSNFSAEFKNIKWYDGAAQPKGDGTLDFMASADIYTVKFYNAEGKVIHTEYVKKGKDAKGITGDPPQKKSDGKYEYRFKEWDTSYKKVTKDLNIRPVYDKSPIKDNDFDPSDIPTQVTTQATTQPPTPTPTEPPTEPPTQEPSSEETSSSEPSSSEEPSSESNPTEDPSSDNSQ